MLLNIFESKFEIYDKEDLSRKDYSSFISAVIIDGIKTGAKIRSSVPMKIEKWFNFKTKVKWENVVWLLFFHMGTLYSLFTINPFGNIATFVWMMFLTIVQAVGVTAGVHRLWSHRAYKAKLPLRILLLIFYATAGQVKIREWVLDHRVHHKYTDTDADPHNSNRGFFFSHVGWLMMKKNPEVIRKGRQIDMSDVLSDPVVKFGDKYFVILKLLFCFVIPIIVPVYGWNETWTRAIHMQVFYRFVYGLNSAWSVNSVAHIWGSKPYDSYINPTQNSLISFLTYGEGWHNYHHVFPWDYKAAELGNYMLNFTTMFIDFFAKIGWAYDLKQPSQQLVVSVIKKRGDGSHQMWNRVAHLDSKKKE